MKKLCINISLFFMLLTLSSCNDWLDEVKQTTTVSDEIIWQDETQVDKYGQEAMEKSIGDAIAIFQHTKK